MKYDLVSLQQHLAKILLGQAAAASNVPLDKVEPGEKVLGIITDPVVRGLWSFADHLADYLKNYLDSTKPENGKNWAPGEKEGHLNHIDEVRVIIKSTARLMWTNIGALYPESKVKSVQSGIREGWELCVWKMEESEDSVFSSMVSSGDFGEILKVISKIQAAHQVEQKGKVPSDTAGKN